MRRWSEGSGPTAKDVIFGWIKWCPEEDFVIVPSEDWVSAPGITESNVLAFGEQARAAFRLEGS